MRRVLRSAGVKRREERGQDFDKPIKVAVKPAVVGARVWAGLPKVVCAAAERRDLDACTRGSRTKHSKGVSGPRLLLSPPSLISRRSTKQTQGGEGAACDTAPGAPETAAGRWIDPAPPSMGPRTREASQQRLPKAKTRVQQRGSRRGHTCGFLGDLRPEGVNISLGTAPAARDGKRAALAE